MSRSIELPDSVRAAIEQAAAAEGTTPEAWIAANFGTPLSTAGSQVADLPVETLTARFRALVARAQGLGGNLATRHSELFAEGLEEKRRVGHL